MPAQCPVCSQTSERTLLEFAQLPLFIGVQWPTAEEARACPRGDIRLRFCDRCGFIWNDLFDAAKLAYSQRYDNSLDFSSVFQEYARGLARRLIETHGIRGKQIIEIGCGKGHFLTLLCEMGHNRGIGFDPSFEGERMFSTCPERLTYIQDVYGEQYAHHRGDLICCRHVFEHIPNPFPFLTALRQTIDNQPDTVVYFEVPNVRFILERLSVWDVIYEHCSYFSRESLGHIFRRCGFRVLDLRDAYDGQFLGLEACPSQSGDSPSTGRPDDLSDLRRTVGQFTVHLRERKERWSQELGRLVEGGRRAVVWGAGAKAVTFLNLLGATDRLPYAVDINPHKQGKHLPGTGQRIVPPDFLRAYRPDAVILMNPIYQAEVAAQLRSLGLAPELLAA